MNTPTLYDEDIYAWAEKQAAVLRRMANRRDLPNDLDLAHVTEEIADLGISELNSAKSFVRNILTHLILAAIDMEANAVRHWLEEIATWHADLNDRLTPAMRRRIDMAQLWSQAQRSAVAKLVAHYESRTAAPIGRLATLAGTPCPFNLDELTSDSLDVLAARDRLRPPAS